MFCKKIVKNEITRPLIHQLIKCGTSVGANYCEADNAESRSDFIHKIGICRKESREAQHFLRMMSSAYPEMKIEARILWKEAQELNLIFNSISRKTKNNAL
ncbi:MAG: four helix bundle protein [bacterium]|nr:four helix bundle protein [bacterium]